MGRVITIIGFAVLGAAGGFVAGKWYEGSRVTEETELEPESKTKSVLAEGKIKPANGIRMVTTLPGRQIRNVQVDVGSQVKAQETELCVMSDEPLLKMQWELAVAKKSDLATEIEQKILAAEMNKVAAEAALKEAKLTQSRLHAESPESSYVDQKIRLSQSKLDRLKELSKDEATSAFVSTQDIFDQELELEKAKADKVALQKAADLAVESATEAAELATKVYENAKSLKQESESLRLAESIAKQQYENSKVLAPIDGEVIKIHSFAGDTVANFPIMEVADLSEMIVEAEVYFANLPLVETGQVVRISSPALSQELTGKVISKSNYIGGSLLQSPNPLAMSDQETAKVKIAIDSKFKEIAKSFLNLQVTVEIETK